MIKNDRQYRITKAAAAKFEDAFRQLASEAARPPEDKVHPLIVNAHRQALKSQLDELQAQLREYEELARGDRGVIDLGSLKDLPQALVQARISSGLNQKDLAAKLGLKEQQIQRYEATDYQHASLSRLLQVADAVNLKIRKELFPATPKLAATMKAYAMSFDGVLLGRGFWLYVWRITAGVRSVLYVGRTGDSSSPHASSPFKRIGQHLDAGPNAKGNALARQLKRVGLPPERCAFEMVAVGPLFPEQKDMERHKIFRDQAGALERALADHLRAAGHTVIGTHPRAVPCDENLREQLCRLVDAKLGAV